MIAAVGRRESKLPSAMSIQAPMLRCSCSSCGITMSLSAARVDARTCHFIVHARAPSVCYAAWSLRPPEAAYGFLPPRIGFDSALGNGGSPKLRRSGYVEVAAHRAEARRSCESISTCDGCGGRAPRIEAAQCDELADSDAPLLLPLMRHNV